MSRASRGSAAWVGMVCVVGAVLPLAVHTAAARAQRPALAEIPN